MVDLFWPSYALEIRSSPKRFRKFFEAPESRPSPFDLLKQKNEDYAGL